MSSIVPSPPVAPDADATTRGVVNPTAADQTLGTGTAIHRFANLVTSALATLQSVLTNLVYATGATLVLRSSLGAGSSDIAVKVGTSETDGTVNTSARLFSARTGIGGTEVESFALLKSGYAAAFGGGTLRFFTVPGGSAAIGFNNSTAAGAGLADIGGSIRVYFDVNGGAEGYVALLGRSGVSASAVGGLTHFDRNQNDEATIHRFDNTRGDHRAAIKKTGRFDQSGSDSSGAPLLPATINKPTGKSAIASGATSVVITNSLVDAGDQVFITWHGDLGTQSKIPWVTTAAGSFTVNVGTAPGSAVAFCWTVQKRI